MNSSSRTNPGGSRIFSADKSFVISAVPFIGHAAEKEVTLVNGILREKSPAYEAWDIGAEFHAAMKSRTMPASRLTRT